MSTINLNKQELLSVRKAVQRILTPEEREQERERVRRKPQKVAKKPITSTVKLAHEYTSKCKDFQSSTIFAVTTNARYVVYSYGEHYPMFIHEEGQWYQNEDRYSPTTTKHHGYAHPRDPVTGDWVQTMPMSTGAMKRIVLEGIAGLAAKGEIS